MTELDNLVKERDALSSRIYKLQQERDFREHILTRVMMECTDLINKIPRFDKMRWDSGQWLCVLEFGTGWNDDPRFRELLNMHPGDWPAEELTKYGRLREWLRAEAGMVST